MNRRCCKIFIGKQKKCMGWRSGWGGESGARDEDLEIIREKIIIEAVGIENIRKRGS